MICDKCGSFTVTYKVYDDENDKYINACGFCIMKFQSEENNNVLYPTSKGILKDAIDKEIIKNLKIDNAEITIEQLIEAELVKANRKFKPFNSTHEGKAVIEEEIDEVNDKITQIEMNYKNLWYGVKKNNSIENLLMYIDDLEKHSINAIKELIQVAAMCKKFRCLKKDDKKIDNSKYDWEFKGNRCSNCHSGILEDKNSNAKRCTMNYINCDYYNSNYESFINTNHDKKKEDDK